MLALTQRRRDVARWNTELWTQPRQLAARAKNRCESQCLCCSRRRTERAQPARMSEQLAERDTAHGALERWPSKVFDLGSTGFGFTPVGNTGRADRLTCPAAEAQIDVAHLFLLERQRPALPLRHEVDAAARRLGLQPGGAESWARVEAQTAVDASGEVVVAQEIEGFAAHTTNLPGFRMPVGSKACLRRPMS